MLTDARTSFTKATIRRVFFSLLQTRPLSKITVTEICSLAEINRATFYKYYDNPYDLLNRLEEEMLDSLRDRLMRSGAGFETALSVVLEDIAAQQQVYDTLFSEHGDDTFRARVLSLCYPANLAAIRQKLPGLSSAEQDYLYYFIAEGFNGILRRWMADGCTEPPAQLIAFMCRLVESINRGV